MSLHFPTSRFGGTWRALGARACTCGPLALLTACQPAPGLLPNLALNAPRFVLNATVAQAEASPPTAANPQASPATPGSSAAPGGSAPGRGAVPVPGVTPSPGPSSAPAGGRGGGASSGAGPTTEPSDASPLPVEPTATPNPPQPAGCSPCDDQPRTGTVVAAEAPFGAIAGATVTSGSVTVVSDGSGAFSLPAPSAASATVAVTFTGRTTSLVAGWLGGDLTLHLARDPRASANELSGGAASFEITGRVVRAGAGGPEPVAGALVTASTPGATFGGPASSRADGSFTLRLFDAPSGETSDVTVWVAQLDGDGVATRLGNSPPLAIEPGTDVGDLALAAPAGEVRLAAPLVPPFAAMARWTLTAVAASGARMVVAASRRVSPVAPVFSLPGVTYLAEGEATGYDGTSTSYWRRVVAAGDAVDATFIRPPEPTAALAWTTGAAWFWRPIPEVSGYRVEAFGADGTPWELFTELPRLTVPATRPAGPAQVRIVATSEGGLRAVSSLRALRLFAPPQRYAVWQGTVP